MHRSPLAGVFAPIVTVFDGAERLCHEAIARNVRLYNQTALTGYMPLGSNGEFQGLRDREAISILRTVCRERTPGKVVVGGCGRESVMKTAAFIKCVASEGLDYAFILPPHYFPNITEDGLQKFYFSMADKSPIPIVVYNAPKFTGGLGISPELCARLAAHPNIAALKNSSPLPNSSYIEAIRGTDLQVLAGNIGNFYTGILEGAVGGVLSTASYLPEYCTALYELAVLQKYGDAERLNEFLQDVSKRTAGPLGVPGVKCAMEARGMNGGHVRLPLLDLPKEYRARFADVFAACGIGRLV